MNEGVGNEKIVSIFSSLDSFSFSLEKLLFSKIISEAPPVNEFPTTLFVRITW